MAKAKRRARPKAGKPKTKSKVKKAASKRAAKAKPKTPAKPKQRFTVSHHREEDFDPGLRGYAKYRDLGISAATSGLVQAHVIRFTPPFRAEEVSTPHYHDVEFQMVYVLKGWIETDLEGQGPIRMRAGSCWIQPPRIKHKVTGYSDDCEVMEIVMPADFETVTLA